MWNNNVTDGGGGYGGVGYPGMGWGGYGGGGFFSGATGGAFGGALVGSLIGDAIFPGGFGRHHGGHDGGEKVVQINGQPGYGYGGSLGQWEIMKEVSDTRYDLASMNYQGQIAALNQQIANDKSFAALQAQICACCCETQRTELETQYKMALMNAGLSREIAECCCKQLLETQKMGFETQLRDQANFGAIMSTMMTQFTELKCLVKDTENNEIIRSLTRENAEKDRRLNTLEIIEAMKPKAAIPAYIQANPYENFMPTVKCTPRCDDRNFFNNNWGFQ